LFITAGLFRTKHETSLAAAVIYDLKLRLHQMHVSGYKWIHAGSD